MAVQRLILCEPVKRRVKAGKMDLIAQRVIKNKNPKRKSEIPERNREHTGHRKVSQVKTGGHESPQLHQPSFQQWTGERQAEPWQGVSSRAVPLGHTVCSRAVPLGHTVCFMGQQLCTTLREN